MTFSGYGSGPSYTAVPITPSDSTSLANPVRSVDVVNGGSVSFVDGRGNTVALPSVPDGYSLTCVVQRINATGTTASGFIGYP